MVLIKEKELEMPAISGKLRETNQMHALYSENYARKIFVDKSGALRYNE
jgi:hypothetical protein